MKRIALLTTLCILIVVTSFAQRRSTKVIDNKGTIKYALDSSSHFIDTAVNGLTKVNDSTLEFGGQLIHTTTLDINGQALQIANLISGAGTDSLVVADPSTGELKRISSSRLLGNLTAKNGLYKDNDSIKLGGSLTEATTISADPANSLTLSSGGAGSIKITGLTSGQVSDSLLVIDPATNNIRYISPSVLLNALYAKNGLTKNGDTVELGGNLNKNTAISTNGNNLTFDVGGSGSDSLNITGLPSGNTATDSIMVVNGATGKVGKVNATALLQSGETSFTATTGTLTYSVSNMPATPSKVWVYRNGAKLVGGSNSSITSDYTVSAGSVTLVENGYTVTTGDIIEVQWVK